MTSYTTKNEILNKNINEELYKKDKILRNKENCLTIMRKGGIFKSAREKPLQPPTKMHNVGFQKMQSVGNRLDFGMDRCLAVCTQRTDCGCTLSKNCAGNQVDVPAEAINL